MSNLLTLNADKRWSLDVAIINAIRTRGSFSKALAVGEEYKLIPTQKTESVSVGGGEFQDVPTFDIGGGQIMRLNYLMDFVIDDSNLPIENADDEANRCLPRNAKVRTFKDILIENNGAFPESFTLKARERAGVSGAYLEDNETREARTNAYTMHGMDVNLPYFPLLFNRVAAKPKLKASWKTSPRMVIVVKYSDIPETSKK